MRRLGIHTHGDADMGASASTSDPCHETALIRLRKRYHVLRYDAEEGFVAHHHLPGVMLDTGRLTVGAVPIHTARFAADHVVWRQQSPGRYSCGRLQVHDHGLSIRGVVHHGTLPADAVRHDVIGTAVKPVAYTTRITRQAYLRTQNVSRIPDAGWQDGLELEIAFALSVGSRVPAPKVWLGGADITAFTTWSVAQNGNTVLTIAAGAAAGPGGGRAARLYNAARLSFNPCIPAPTGSGSVAAPEGAAADAKVHFWIARPSVAAQQQKLVTLERISPADVVPGDPCSEDLMLLPPDDAVAASLTSRIGRPAL